MTFLHLSIPSDNIPILQRLECQTLTTRRTQKTCRFIAVYGFFQLLNHLLPCESKQIEIYFGFNAHQLSLRTDKTSWNFMALFRSQFQLNLMELSIENDDDDDLWLLTRLKPKRLSVSWKIIASSLGKAQICFFSSNKKSTLHEQAIEYLCKERFRERYTGIERVRAIKLGFINVVHFHERKETKNLFFLLTHISLT